jgi:hypothetical protein
MEAKRSLVKSINFYRLSSVTSQKTVFITWDTFRNSGHINGTKTPWPESASELYRPNAHRLSAKLLPTFADRGCRVSVTNPYGRNLGFLDWSRYFFFQAAPKLYSRGWVDPIPDTLLFDGTKGDQYFWQYQPTSVSCTAFSRAKH